MFYSVTLVCSQPLYRSWNMLLVLAVVVTDQRQAPQLPSPLLPLAFCSMVLMGPKAVSMNETSLLFSQGANSFQITNKSTILGTNRHRSCFPLIICYSSILLLYINPYFIYLSIIYLAIYLFIFLLLNHCFYHSSYTELMKFTTLLVNLVQLINKTS